MSSSGRMTRNVSCCGQASQRWQMAKEKVKKCAVPYSGVLHGIKKAYLETQTTDPLLPNLGIF